MDDLVDRLRALARAEHDDLSVAAEAADEIERLRTEQRDLMTCAAAEAWRFAVQAAQDSYNDQALAEMPEHSGELIVQNVMVGWVRNGKG
jgi:hypothetical protein